MLTAPTVPCRHEPAAVLQSGNVQEDPAVGCGGWHASSAELRLGLEVIEHDGLPQDFAACWHALGLA